MIKKLSMLTVKAAIGLLPVSIKNNLKKNARLTEFYSRSLKRSGLFFGYPSPKKIQALYVKRLAVQKKELNGYNTSGVSCKVVISGFNIKLISESVSSFDGQSLSVKAFFVNDSVVEQLNGFMLPGIDIKPISLLSKNEGSPVLLIREGESVCSKQLLQALSKYEANSKNQLIYFDWHYLDNNGKPTKPQLLPDWNPDLQLSTGYVKTAIWLYEPATWFGRFPLGEEYYCWLAQIALCEDVSVCHVPYAILSASDKTSMDKVDLELLKRTSASKATGVVDHNNNRVSLMWPLHTQPLVSLIIPTYNGKKLVQACINSILEKTTYSNYEIILVDNNSDDLESLNYFEVLNAHPKITVLSYPFPFNYSAINNFAAKQARGEIIGLINNDIEIITPEWLEFMVGHAKRPEIGCVGAKLLYADGSVQHAGVVMGYGGGAGHAHKYFPRTHPGYLNRLVSTQNFSAVTAACLMVKKSLWNEVGGLNEVDLKVAFNDVDFCLRVLETGVRNLYCAEAEMFHYESISRGLDISPEKAQRFKQELDYLQTTWAKYIQHDPAYNPNLTLARENFSIRED
ncbi:glycosyltransferase family 2 protein [Alteromonas sp. ASW11-130]|uniref:glycosyltransferase family 2 protein n=1 Tax=Alteromonas sp. ASW11-130 TaxID=3015775 RepID=UPI0022423751|nr:glycosyltransferase family 2 protein [Alteromonas sp. ASW11-130]MCW8090792.1 glycosyltransferase family 2 protein [Alteromonas sp. ASW11-130]